MKKILICLALIFTLTSCDFQSRDDFEKDIAKDKINQSDFDMPEITYIKEGEPNESYSEKAEEEIDLDNMYGSGKFGKDLNLNEAVGNIVDMRIGDSQIGISLSPSNQYESAYSAILSYKRNNELEEREFGPIAGFSGLSTMVSFDKIESESGPMLLVSQITVNNGQSYSAYYLFNKFMSLMDYLIFSSSVDNTMPTVERLGDIIEYTDQAVPGDISSALANRFEAEDRYLPGMLDPYGVSYKQAKSLVEGKEAKLGYLPDISGENRILLMKTSTSLTDMGMNIDIEK